MVLAEEDLKAIREIVREESRDAIVDLLKTFQKMFRDIRKAAEIIEVKE